MTARQEARVGSRATGGDAWSYETQRAPNVGEILQTARERKGVDLSRAERETKIRARHLMALESGDFADLPAHVYAKGFLRNYSTYLGLDADEVLARWRKEVDQPQRADTVRVKPPPQPISTPSRGFKLTGGLIVALILAVIVTGFVGYVALQLVRFTQNPEISLNGPAVRQLQPGADRLLLNGYGTPNTEVTASGPDELLTTTVTDERGTWKFDLKVSKGQNDFTIFTTDLDTARASAPLQVQAIVPVATEFTSDARTAPALPDGADTTSLSGPPSAEVALAQPTRGLVSETGKIRVEGTSDADSVLVSFQWRGAEGAARIPPSPKELAVTDGTFKGVFTLPKGKWQTSVAAAIDGGTPLVVTVPVRSRLDKLILVVAAVGGDTRLKITDLDDVVIIDGMRLEEGQSRQFSLDAPVILRVGNARAANLTIDGVEYGSLGTKAEAKAWQLIQDQRPKPTS